MSHENQPNKKYPIYFYFILVAVLILFFVTLEGSLRLFNYGDTIPQWVQLSANFPNKITLNHNIAKRYFSNIQEYPTPWPDGFDRNKLPNTFRIFILGESSAAGYPYDVNTSFPREIKRRLDILYPNTNNEVINISMSAISSYVLADLIDGIIEQQPDLIIIYTGHNEYYGALGVGSSENLGAFPSVVRFLIKAESLKTIQLLKNSIKTVISWFCTHTEESGTLMKRMVGEQYIPLHSELYHLGINQFTSNMTFILDNLTSHHIPVIIGNLTSNIRSQKPFVSQAVDSLLSADELFNQADKLLSTDKQKAKKLFIQAKENDLLRFRAPNDINNVIKELSNKYHLFFTDIDSVFNAASQFGITGDDLMIDHLHPNIKGYRLMGETFFNIMLENHLLPKENAVSLTNRPLNNEADRVFPMTGLDSLLAEVKIKRLKASWPFIDKDIQPIDPLSVFQITDLKSKLVYDILTKKLNWEQAHFQLGQDFLAKKDYNNFCKEFNALIAYAPYNESPYEFVANQLITAGLFKDALPYLIQVDKIKTSAFSNKWLGIIALLDKKYDSSISYLEKSFRFNSSDPQVAYNLAGAYWYKNKKDDALRLINQAITLKPNYEDAVRFRDFISRNMTK